MWRRFVLFCIVCHAPKLATSPGTEVYKQVLQSEEDRETLSPPEYCYCCKVAGEKKMCLCKYDMGNEIHVKCARSQGENNVIALHLNLSADELSPEGNIFAHERFIRTTIAVLPGLLIPTREGGVKQQQRE